MTSKAHAEYDPTHFGLRIAVRRERGGFRELLTWQPVTVTTVDEERPIEAPDDVWLRLPEEDARAMYEALADYFGHAGHDTRALRKDYDAERARVDLMIRHLTGGAR